MWRVAVQRGLDTLETGIDYHPQYHQRGRKKTEEHSPNIVDDIRALIDGDCQADPKFQTTFQYCRISARAVREALITQKGYQDEDLPSRQTIGNLLNRWGYRLKKHYSVEAVLGWAANMQWNGKTPTVHHITESYEKNVKVDQETLANYLIDWHPSDDLPKWAVTVEVLNG